MLTTPVQNILFLDIETVSRFESYDQMPDEWRTLWDKKAEALLRNNKDAEDAESLFNRSGIYAEYGKIICISCGIISHKNNEKRLIIKSFYGDDEKELLKGFIEMLNKWAVDDSKFLCAHNGKEFDFPYLCRRMIINQLSIPHILQFQGKKPWDIKHFDTLELWKFGDYKNYTSLELLALCLGIPTPKDDINGSMVNEVYWTEKNIERIVTYCQKDVVTLVQVFLGLNNEVFILSENVEIK